MAASCVSRFPTESSCSDRTARRWQQRQQQPQRTGIKKFRQRQISRGQVHGIARQVLTLTQGDVELKNLRQASQSGRNPRGSNDHARPQDFRRAFAARHVVPSFRPSLSRPTVVSAAGHLLATAQGSHRVLGTPVDDMVANTIIAQLLFLESEDPDKT